MENYFGTSESDPTVNKVPKTVGQLIDFLLQFESKTPIEVGFDHSITICSLNGDEDRRLHTYNINIEIDSIE